jgi:hypothetical protein
VLRSGWRSAAIIIFLLCTACRQPSKPAATTSRGPQVRATVVEISTTVEPSKRTSKHTIVIAPGKARSTADAVRWRLFDLQKNEVITVDDDERTFRREPLAQLIARRRTQLQREVPSNLPRAEYSVTNESRPLHGVAARQSLVRMGAYERQIWVGAHPQIPAQLFAMMHAAEEPTALAPLARGVEDALLNLRGFPLLDHSELPYGDAKLIVDRAVTAIRQQDVDASMLEIPKEYREIGRLQPPTAPAANRRPAS